MTTIRVKRDNDADLAFEGELIASTESQCGDRQSTSYSGSTGRWTELNLYRTQGGSFVCQSIGHTKWDDEHTRYAAQVCASEAEVIAYFGSGWLAKQLYAEARIEHVERIA